MSSYTTVPPGIPIQPASASYRAVTLPTGNTIFTWPTSFFDTDNIIASWMNITGVSGSIMALPDATLVSVGTMTIIANIGSSSFTINDNVGSPLLTITTGQQYLFLLTDNTDQAGTWYILLYGSGSSTPIASALAGLGLIALPYDSTKLNTETLVITINAPRSIAYTDRSSLIIWTGGTVNLPLPLCNATNIGNGFNFSISNQGTGQVTLITSGSDLIDGNSAFVLSLGASTVIACDGGSPGNYYTLGLAEINLDNVTWPNGISALPAIRFTSDVDTGMYLDSSTTHTLAFSSNGIPTLKLTPTAVLPQLQILGVNTATPINPTYSFAGFPNYGIYLGDTNTALVFSIAGNPTMYLTSLLFGSYVPLEVISGTVSNVAYGFNTPTGNQYGMWLKTGGTNLAFSNGGIEVLEFSNTAMSPQVTIQGMVGSSTSRSYTFAGSIGANTSGLYYDISTNEIRIGFGNRDVLNLSVSAILPQVEIQALTGTTTAEVYGYSFVGYDDSGLWYNTTTNAVSISVDGIKVFDATDTQVVSYAPFLVNNNILCNGSILLDLPGSGIVIAEGANARMGQVTLSGGTATVANISITGNTRIFLTRYDINLSGQIGQLIPFLTSGVGFVINSVDGSAPTVPLAGDNSMINWLLIEGQ